MKIYQQIERFNHLHEMIKQRRTGSPKQLAKKLYLSESYLYKLIEKLKLDGAPIKYSRTLESYYYETEYVWKFMYEKGLIKDNSDLRASSKTV